MSEPRGPASSGPDPQLPPPDGGVGATDGSFAPPSGGEPSLPPTEAMPATPSASGDAGAAAGAGAVGAHAASTGPGVPPPTPGATTAPTGPGGPTTPGDDTAIGFDDRPWWKTPGGIAAIVIGVLLALTLIAWLIWGGDDEPEADPILVRLELTAVDPSGAPLDRSFVASVTGQPDAADDYIWVLPSAGEPGERGGTTDDDGVITFAWEPDDDLVEREAWESRITVVQNSPAGSTPPGPTVDCVLDRIDQQPSTVTMSAEVDPPDPAVEQFVTYTFPNHVFLPGDLVTCELVSSVAPPTTTTSTTTTVVETTTTSTTTTVVETTTTTEATTTVPDTTLPPDTTVPPPDTTVPPANPATAREALEADGNFGTFLSLVDQVPSVSALLDGPGPITVFAPTDDALDGITPPTGDELEQLLLAHLVDGEALDSATLFDGRTEITMADGTVQSVDAAAQTVGGIPVSVPDLIADNGVSHGIDSVLAPLGP